MTTQTNNSSRQPRAKRLGGVWVDQIAGRYRAIPVRQLAMAWWCYLEGLITYRQLRIFFAAHEMAEQRRYTEDSKGGRKPSYKLEQIRSLVEGRGSASADASLAGDIRRLARLRLVTIEAHTISFAGAIDEIEFGGNSGFCELVGQLPHPERTVPVPRRMLRALAGGLPRGAAAVVLATLIRSLFWHKKRNAFQIDGRTKREWVTDVFGVSPRSVTEGRAKLIEIGWLVPLETTQSLLNRYGSYDRVNTEWCAAKIAGEAEEGDTDLAAESASPSGAIRGNSASPLNRSLPLSGNQLTTRKLGRPSRTGRHKRSGVSTGSTRKGCKQRMRRSRSRRSTGLTIRDIRMEDLSSTKSLLELHRQACQLSLSSPSEAGRLEFFSLAERARCRGKKPGAYLFWLLREQKSEIITQGEEDRAAARLRELRNGPRVARVERVGSESGSTFAQKNWLTDDEWFVVACIRAAKRVKDVEPFRIAQQTRGWSREQWDIAECNFQSLQIERQRRDLE